MIDSTCESQQLPATFTFRVVEIAKTIRVRPLPRISWLPLGVSAVTGIIIVALSFLSPMASPDSVYMEPTLLPREQIIISGKVMADGAPVPDARVYVHETNAYTREGGIVAEGETQADGSFQLEIPGRDDREWRSAALELVAQHPQHSFGWSGLSKGNTADLVIELSQPWTIAGTVTDQADNPIQGADIRIYWLSRVEAGQQSGSGILGGALSGIMANTDSDGKFVLRSLPENSSMILHALAPGYARESVSGIHAGAVGLTFRLKREARIAGRVTFGKKGEPAKGIKVSCQELDATFGWAEAYTDENGDYALTNLSAGTYNVGLAKMIPDWTAAAEEFVYAVEGQTTKDVNLTLVKGGFIEGRVTEEDTHKPISTHWVGFHDAARPESQAAIFGAETDGNGFYRFRAAPGKALVYSFPPEGYEYSSEAKHHVDVVEGGTLSVDFRFRKSEAVTLTGIEQMAWREYARSAQKRLEELIGKPAMELEVASWLYGEPVTLAELKGKVIALHFWSGQNTAEVEKIRFVNALQQAYGDRGLVCIGIHESMADLDDIMDLITEKGITYRIAIDKESPIESAKGVTFHKYAVAWFPNNIVLINMSGVIHSNTQRDQEIEEAIQKLLSD